MKKRIGDVLTAKINMDLIGEISSLGFDIKFDSEYLEFVDLTKNGLFDMEIVKQSEGDSTIINAGLVESDEYIRDTTVDLFQARFKCLKSGNTQIVFLPENREVLKDSTPANIEQEWLDGFIEISGDRIILSIVIE